MGGFRVFRIEMHRIAVVDQFGKGEDVFFGDRPGAKDAVSPIMTSS